MHVILHLLLQLFKFSLRSGEEESGLKYSLYLLNNLRALDPNTSEPKE